MLNKDIDESTIDSDLLKKHKTHGLIKKTVLTTVLGFGLTFSMVHANEMELSSVVHVYVDGEHVGTVDSKEIVQSFVDDMIEQQAKENKDFSYTVGEEITYVSEKVFNPSTSNQEVISQLDEDLSVKVNAYELKIGDIVVGYFKDKETAETTLNNYKAKYVDLDVLESLEKNSSEDFSLSLGDSTIVDVKLSEKVSLSQQKASPKEILTEKEGKTLLEKGTLEDKKHKVEEGEVLGKIASKYDLDIDTILELNPSITEESILQIGQEINVTDYAPFLDVIVKQEKLVEEDINYKTEVKTTDDLYKGDTKVSQTGQNGVKKVHYAIEKVNGNTISTDVVESEVTKEPVKEIILKGTKVVPSRGSGQFKWPAVGGRITSYVGQRWGRQHKGIDIAGVSNRTIMAADNGVVVSAGYSGGFGNKVVINHNNGYKSIYAHLSSINVSVGQTVTKGKNIGVMGSTGNSTGVHLHFEVYKNGALINPLDLL